MILRRIRSTEPAWAASFSNRDFRLLWMAGTLHALNWGMEQVAIGWLVLNLTDSPFMVGLAYAAGMAPFFFFGTVSGAIADRVNRRIFLRFVFVSGSVVAGAMAVLMILEIVVLWPIILLAVAAGSLKAFFGTISQAYTFDLIGPQRALNGLALMSMSHKVGALVGSLLSGFVISQTGVGGQYVFISITYIIGAGVLLANQENGQAYVVAKGPVFKNLITYFRLLQQNSVLMTLMFLVAITEVFGFTHSSVLPVFARDVLEVGEIGLGVMLAFNHVGGVVGLIFLASLRRSTRNGLYMLVAATGFGLGLMAFSLFQHFIFYLLVILVVNAFAATADTLYRTLIQSSVPNEQRGRATGSWVLAIGTAPIGHLGLGGMAGLIGAPRAVLVNGAILALVNLISLIGLPKIRKLQ